MTGRLNLRILSCVLAVGLAGCASFYEIPIETPIAAKLDVSAFQRVFIAGFLAGGTDDVDGNLETGPPAEKPAAHEVEPARHRRRRAAADGEAANSRPQGQARRPGASREQGAETDQE